MMKAIFVTGTGTGVGKTVVGGALCSYLSLKKGLKVGVMKPVETGWDPKNSDAMTLKVLSGSEDPIEEIVPYRFDLPVAPLVAARSEKKDIDLGVLDEVYKKLLSRHDLVIVESAGGILVPIKEGFFFLDLVKRWNVPVLVVSENRLGTINHTLLTCHYLILKNVPVLGVILNNKEEELDISAQSNASVLEEFLPVPFLGSFPYLGKVKIWDLREKLAEFFESSIRHKLLPL
ncbi:MAG: dethiobiotin synthase [Desulfobacterota bacterium]|nr:dethiobiotin synthase [Thermodesulfobacteriota bacterium]MDW8001235.1 dethiobiotin synthase [Deltaproteobacteria bacterium]